jgi:hypothetical protein
VREHACVTGKEENRPAVVYGHSTHGPGHRDSARHEYVTGLTDSTIPEPDFEVAVSS